MKVAIVGSRGFNEWRIIEACIDRLVEKYGTELTIVSGGARGADSAGETIAIQRGVARIIHLPEWDKYGKSAGFRRNDLIVADADMVLAFYAPGPRSRGTSNTVASAKIAGKPVHVYHEGVWS